MSWKLALPSWIRRFTLGTARYRWERVEEVPEEPSPGVVYLIGDGPEAWSAAMVCPCGCQALVSLSLIPTDRPRWKASVNAVGEISLHPSVWRKRGCRSHYSVIRGRIVWARGRARAPD